VAEYALKTLLGPESGYVVRSAGTEAVPQTVSPLVLGWLRERGADASRHVPRQLTHELLDSTHVPVAMGLDHKEFIRQRFNRDARLFNEICFDKPDSILDVHEAVPDWHLNAQASRDYALSVIDYIWNAMPAFLARIRQL
jgi:protein-tyrosine-phosphatase